MTAQIATAAIARNLPSLSSLCCMGVFMSGTDCIMDAILPTSVSFPTAVTIPRPCPYVTPHEANAILLLFPTGTETADSGSSPAFRAIGSLSFSTGTDSPVRAASCIFRLAVSVSLMSAGTVSPVPMTTRSPFTSSRVAMTCTSPSRTTLQ